jgi:hypothetical protein
MIDTIVLRVHNLGKYDPLIRWLNLQRNSGIKLKNATVDEKEFERIEKMKHFSPTTRLDIMEFTGSGEYLIKTQISKMVSTSGHYAFTYRIDYTRDFMELNFSIPKYRYGTNVFMYVEHIRNRDFKYYQHSTLEYNLDEAPKKIISAIVRIIRSEFGAYKIDFRDVEVNRIDVCFNQVFKSKEDALVYFNYQKKLKKKNSRDGDGGKTDYDTSFSYVTKLSSSKIYHKGTEYKKHDLKEHLKYNERKGYEHFETKKIQAFADRILRYEVTIRSGELNYLFKHNLFRKDCPFYQIHLKDYTRISNTLKRNERISKKIGELPESEKALFKRLNPYERISSDDRKLYKSIAHIIGSKPYFMMVIGEDEKLYNLKTVNYQCMTALFSKELIKLCLKKLLGFITEFQIKELPDIERVIILIDKYNSEHTHGFQKSDMIQFYEQLIKHGSFKEAANAGGHSRATLYRYKDRFKRIGILENSVQPNNEYSIPKAPLDLKEYHSILTYSTLNKIAY